MYVSDRWDHQWHGAAADAVVTAVYGLTRESKRIRQLENLVFLSASPYEFVVSLDNLRNTSDTSENGRMFEPLRFSYFCVGARCLFYNLV